MDKNNMQWPRHEFVKINVLRMRRNNPCATLQSIGDRFSVTRERARQILSKEGKPTVAYHQTYLCNQCSKNLGTRPKLFCNIKCRYDYTHVTLECPICGQLFQRSQSEVKFRSRYPQSQNNKLLQHFFCSRKCVSKSIDGYRPRKWDWEPVFLTAIMTGFGSMKLNRLYFPQIPTSTIDAILSKTTKGIKNNSENG